MCKQVHQPQTDFLQSKAVAYTHPGAAAKWQISSRIAGSQSLAPLQCSTTKQNLSGIGLLVLLESHQELLQWAGSRPAGCAAVAPRTRWGAKSCNTNCASPVQTLGTDKQVTYTSSAQSCAKKQQSLHIMHITCTLCLHPVGNLATSLLYMNHPLSDAVPSRISHQHVPDSTACPAQ